MINMLKKLQMTAISLLCAMWLCACGGEAGPFEVFDNIGADSESIETTQSPSVEVSEGEYYYDSEHVILYLDTFGHLPGNYITKDEARKLGWDGGTIEDFKEGLALGGTYYGNYEGILPKEPGIEYSECDIDTHPHKPRGAKRLVYSNDGRYYYTEDHYETFVEMIVVDGRVEEAK